MSRKGLSYEVTPDLVRSGAPAHPSGAPAAPPSVPVSHPQPESEPVGPGPQRTSSRTSRRLEYEPAPFPGVLSPPGPSPKAIAALKEQGMWTEVPVPVPSAAVEVPKEPLRAHAPPVTNPGRPATPNSATRAATRPSEEPPVTAPRAAPSAGPARHAPPPKPPRPAPRERPKAPEVDAEARVARTIRLAPNVDAQVQAIAARFGVDLTAAVAIAVTHGYASLAASGLLPPVRAGEPL